MKTTDASGGSSKTKYLKINYNPQTSIFSQYNQTQLSNVSVAVLPGKISFSLKKAGTVSASLYSLTGQRVAVLADNRRIAANGTYSVNALKVLSNGLYLLRCEVVTTEGITNIKRRITFVKN